MGSRSSLRRLKISRNCECETCDGSGVIVANGRRYVCPVCGGKVYRRSRKGYRSPIPCQEAKWDKEYR